MKRAAVLLCLFWVAGLAKGETQMKTQTVEYRDGDVVLEGYLAYDSTLSGKRPGVVVIHEWYGLNDYAKRRAEQLAQLGYVAMAIDMYGKGVRPTTNEEAGKMAGQFYQDRPMARVRALAGLEVLKKQLLVDTTRLAAIGYCFGGGMALEMARSGYPLAGVVSFHGNLKSGSPEDARNIKANVLVCHGAADPFSPMEDVAAFTKEMNDAKVNWELNLYGGAVHGFTNSGNTGDPSTGLAYDRQADVRSWMDMQRFFDEIFR